MTLIGTNVKIKVPSTIAIAPYHFLGNIIDRVRNVIVDFLKKVIEEMYNFIITLFKRNGLYLKFKTVFRNFSALLNVDFSNTE
jgi:hypothetical protein